VVSLHLFAVFYPISPFFIVLFFRHASLLPPDDFRVLYLLIITLIEGGLLIFLQIRVEKLVLECLGIEPKTLDLSSQSGAYDLSTVATLQVDCPESHLEEMITD